MEITQARFCDAINRAPQRIQVNYPNRATYRSRRFHSVVPQRWQDSADPSKNRQKVLCEGWRHQESPTWRRLSEGDRHSRGGVHQASGPLWLYHWQEVLRNKNSSSNKTDNQERQRMASEPPNGHIRWKQHPGSLRLGVPPKHLNKFCTLRVLSQMQDQVKSHNLGPDPPKK